MQKYLLWLILAGMTQTLPAADMNYPNRYSSMAESMFDMMDAFASAYQSRTDPGTGGSGGWQNFSTPWTSSFPSYGLNSLGGWPGYGGFPGMGSMPGIPYAGSYPSFRNWQQYLPNTPGWSQTYGQSRANPLNGSWQGQLGEMMVIKGERFRIYQQRNNYRDGSIKLLSGERLLLHDPATKQSRVYEFAESQGRLAMRDQHGNVLLYRRYSR